MCGKKSTDVILSLHHSIMAARNDGCMVRWCRAFCAPACADTEESAPPSSETRAGCGSIPHRAGLLPFRLPARPSIPSPQNGTVGVSLREPVESPASFPQAGALYSARPGSRPRLPEHPAHPANEPCGFAGRSAPGRGIEAQTSQAAPSPPFASMAYRRAPRPPGRCTGGGECRRCRVRRFPASHTDFKSPVVSSLATLRPATFPPLSRRDGGFRYEKTRMLATTLNIPGTSCYDGLIDMEKPVWFARMGKGNASASRGRLFFAIAAFYTPRRAAATSFPHPGESLP